MSPYLLILVLHTALVFISVWSCAELTAIRCEQCEKALGGCWDEHKSDGNECHGAAIQENLILANGGNCARSAVPASCECNTIEQKLNSALHATSITSGVFSVSPVDSTFFKLTVGWSTSNASETGGRSIVTLTTRPGDAYICCATNPSTSLEMLLPYQQFDQVDVDVSPPFCQKTGNVANSFHFPTISLPSSCRHIIAGSDPSVCTPPRYGSPQDITISTYPVLKDAAGKILIMDAHISWIPSHSGPQYPLPALYYVDINFQMFFKTNATSIVITGMDATMQYQVSLEAYVPCAGCSVATFYKSFSCCTPFDGLHHHRRSDAMETMFADTSAISQIGHMGVVTALFLLIVVLVTIPIVFVGLVRNNRTGSVRSGLDKHAENTSPHLSSPTVSLWLPMDDEHSHY
eukprot:Em0021g977a